MHSFATSWWRQCRKWLYATPRRGGNGAGHNLAIWGKLARGGEVTAMGDRAAYRHAVEAAAAQASSDLMLSRDATYAAVGIAALFTKAHRAVHILSRKLSEDVYGDPDVIAAAVEFFERSIDSRVEILIESDIDQLRHPFLAALRGYRGRLTLAVVPKEIQRTYDFNFAVADQLHFRLEHSRHSREAVMAFNQRDIAQQLVEVFEKLSFSAPKAIAA